MARLAVALVTLASVCVSGIPRLADLGGEWQPVRITPLLRVYSLSSLRFCGLHLPLGRSLLLPSLSRPPPLHFYLVSHLAVAFYTTVFFSRLTALCAHFYSLGRLSPSLFFLSPALFLSCT